MNTPQIDYLQSLASGVSALNDKLNQCFRSWEPDMPPATVIFAELGDSISEHLTVMPADVRREIFARIENGMTSSDEVLRTAVATGLIEAFVSSADKNQELWEQFEKLLGPASLKHAVVWRRFGQETEEQTNKTSSSGMPAPTESTRPTATPAVPSPVVPYTPPVPDDASPPDLG